MWFSSLNQNNISAVSASKYPRLINVIKSDNILERALVKVKHFLTLRDLTADQLVSMIDRAILLKKDPRQAEQAENKTLGLIFEKSSTRTRVAFEVAMRQLNGGAIFLSNADAQFGRGEPLEDTARVMSRMVDCVAIRTFSHEKLTAFAEHSTVPVINALTDRFHPCQLLADIQTYKEHRGNITGKVVTWVGDGNNMCNSYINAAKLLDFEIRIASPEGFEPDPELVADAKRNVALIRDPREAVRNSDLIVTDVWASMGQEAEQERRKEAFEDYKVTTEIMDLAKPSALFMHCLPAHRGEEVSGEVLDHPDSVVWDEAENRMHSQKALMEYLLHNT
ncbi:MAG: ornithine carbamoyltransferase [Deltaproteobacteria bacterium]|jgi:ornithine carbamoyltransferase|nr:ornithine carbamoyltransferase [Deltaproteobacteria bacterium]|tara:strand:+ start:2667 stop:3674 length:1008 start_codon:yes stop_codon:yes gene_type:complete